METSLPPSFPPMTLNIMRCMAALDDADGQGNQSRLINALETLYDDYWVNHQETNDPQVLQQLLERVLGRDGTTKVTAIAPTDGKAALLRNTDAAFAAGAFGLPWLVCTTVNGETESFWGVDHLGQVASFLGLQRPSTGAWRALL